MDRADDVASFLGLPSSTLGVSSFILSICLSQMETTWATFTQYHRLDGLNSRNVFLIDLEAGKSKTRVSAWSLYGEGSLPGLSMAVFLLCLHLAERERSSVMSLHLRALIP